MQNIKAYWQNLKVEFEAEHKTAFLKDYDKSVPYFKKLEQFLLQNLKNDSKNIDAICTLASVKLELRDSEDLYIGLLKDFLAKYKNTLNDKDKARIYTNIGFYCEYSKEGFEYLLKAKRLNSPFLQSYKGLGLYAFSDYQNHKDMSYVKESLEYFKDGARLENSYEMRLGIGVSLFELGEYEEARGVFESLLLEYRGRKRVILSLAYCEIYLKNKQKALSYLAQISDGVNERYGDLNSDEIEDFEIYNAYYVMEEYELFLKECERVILQYFFADVKHYYYSLWITGKKDKFNEDMDIQKSNILKSIENAKEDEDFESEEEMLEYIQSCKEDLRALTDIESKIKNEGYKPALKLSLYPEFSCFLIDCVRHGFDA